MDHLEPLEDYDRLAPNRSPIAKIFALLAVACIAVLVFRTFGPVDAMERAGWTKDWDAAVTQSKSSGKPALLLFTADWCPACRQLESESLADGKVQQYLRDNYTLVLVDLSDRNGPNNSRASEFGVKSIPTLILYDKAGKEKSRTFGMPAAPLMAWLKSDGTAFANAQ